MENFNSMNITKTNVYGNCDLKCAYNYNYNQSNSIVKNNGDSISLTYDKGHTSQVIFNNQKYYVSNIKIYSPSINIYNDLNTNAEMIIEHSPELGGENLFVCIPITKSSQLTETSNVLIEIINKVSANAPSNGEITNLNIPNFSLQNFIPTKPFFNYTSESGLIGQVIAFSIFDAITLTPKILQKLNSIITQCHLKTKGNHLFFNPNGPNYNNNGGEQGIYISCQPTGNSIEKKDVTYINTTATTNYDIDLSQNVKMFIKLLIGIIIFIVILIIINVTYKYLTTSSKNTNMNSVN